MLVPTATAQTEDCRSLDGSVYLCDSQLEDGTAIIEFYSEENTTVTLGDAGVFLAGGEVTTQDFVLNADRRETVHFDVTVSGGNSGVAIETDEGQFGEPLSTDTGPWYPSLPGEPSTMDWVVASITVLGTTTVIIGVLTWWFRSAKGGAIDVF
ncbi:hypothetical protein [Natrialba sp. SSL1]|uniref:hypothetical protein n=1 Tax=Natrialba sp. SSL1 TaxID=1869245 RepID=UPI0011143F53|nr:hypothetical protein [Natrialba sp. SSL1]